MLIDRRPRMRRFWTVIWDNTDRSDEWSFLASAGSSNRVLFVSSVIAVLGSVAIMLILYLQP